MIKKAFTLFLMIVLALSLFVTPVFAVETEADIVTDEAPGSDALPADEGDNNQSALLNGVTDAAMITETGLFYPTLQAAIDAAESGQTVRLLADCSVTTLYIYDDDNLTLDLNGKILSGDKIEGYIDISGKLTLIDGNSSAEHIGTTLPNGGCITLYSHIFVNSEGKLTMNGGSIAQTSRGVYSNGSFTMNAGTITDNHRAVTCAESAVFTMKNVIISGNDSGVVLYDSSKLIIPDGCSPKIIGNKWPDRAYSENLWIDNEKAVVLEGSLGADAEIGIGVNVEYPDGFIVSEAYSDRFTSDMDSVTLENINGKTVTKSRISSQPSKENSYTVGLNTAGLNNPTIEYYWQRKTTGNSLSNLTGYTDGDPVDDDTFDIADYILFIGTVNGNSISSGKYNVVGLENIDYISLGLSYYSARDKTEFVFDCDEVPYTDPEFIYSLTKSSDNKYHTEDMELFFKAPATITDVKLNDFYIYLPKETSAKLGSYEVGSTYRCVLFINGFPLYSENISINMDTAVNTDDLNNVLNSYKNNPQYSGKTLNIEFKTGDITETDKEMVKEMLNPKKKVDYADSSVFLKITDGSGSSEKNIGDEIASPINITYAFDFTKKTDLQVIRVHYKSNGEAVTEELTETPNADGEFVAYDRQGGTITVTAKKYSTYAFAYNDVTTPAPVNPGKTPKTGDTASIALYAAICVTALLMAAAVIFLKKKAKR